VEDEVEVEEEEVDDSAVEEGTVEADLTATEVEEEEDTLPGGRVFPSSPTLLTSSVARSVPTASPLRLYTPNPLPLFGFTIVVEPLAVSPSVHDTLSFRFTARPAVERVHASIYHGERALGCSRFA
jgi:hypothetical protein